MSEVILAIDVKDKKFKSLNQTEGALHVTTSGKAVNFEQITVDNTAGGKALTAAKYAGCSRAVITVETAQIRFRVDGQAAVTSSVGHILNIGEILELDSLEDIKNFRAIRTGGDSALISVTYFK